MIRTYAYTALVCHPNGRWDVVTGEFSREMFHSHTSPGSIPRLALADARKRFPAASHLHIQKTRLKKTTKSQVAP